MGVSESSRHFQGMSLCWQKANSPKGQFSELLAPNPDSRRGRCAVAWCGPPPASTTDKKTKAQRSKDQAGLSAFTSTTTPLSPASLDNSYWSYKFKISLLRGNHPSPPRVNLILPDTLTAPVPVLGSTYQGYNLNNYFCYHLFDICLPH